MSKIKSYFWDEINMTEENNRDELGIYRENGIFFVTHEGDMIFHSANLTECLKYMIYCFNESVTFEEYRKNNYLTGRWPKV